MERRKKKTSGAAGFLTGLGVAAGAGLLAFGAIKLVEGIFKDSPQTQGQRATAGANRNQNRGRRARQRNQQDDRIKPDFSDVENRSNWAEQSEIDCEDSEFLCPISKDFMHDPYILTTCGHSFEKRNIHYWVTAKGTCPVCNRKARVDDLIPNFALKTLMDKKKRELRQAKN